MSRLEKVATWLVIAVVVVTAGLYIYVHRLRGSLQEEPAMHQHDHGSSQPTEVRVPNGEPEGFDHSPDAQPRRRGGIPQPEARDSKR